MSKNVNRLKLATDELIGRMMELESELDEEENENARTLIYHEMKNIKSEVEEIIENIRSPILYSKQELRFLNDNKHLSHQITKIMELSGERNKVLIVEEYLRTGDIDMAVSNLKDLD